MGYSTGGNEGAADDAKKTCISPGTPFRGWSIRLRGKISIRNDIERLIRKG